MAGIYVHIPFCARKCAYCDFYSGPFSRDTHSAFAAAVAAEYASRRSELTQTVTTVYLGGGTPSALSREALGTLFSTLPTSGILEYTIEVNPEDVDPGFVRWLAEDTPVTRVSMGVQTLDDNTLRLLRRRHTAHQALQAARLITGSSLDLSLDLIYGLPGQTLAEWERSLRGVLELRPGHLSCYLLSYEPGTLLTIMRDRGTVDEADEATAEAMYALLCETTASAGYTHYEISNFALPGHRALHNSSYWNLTPYLGLGPGAHSFDGVMRRHNPPSLKRYLECRGTGITEEEPETISEKINDFILTALRTREGIDLNRSEALFGSGEAAREEAVARTLAEAVTIDGRRIAIPESRWLTSDATILHFIL